MRSGIRTKAHWQEYIGHSRRQIWGGTWQSWRVWMIVLFPYAIGAGAGWFLVPALSEPVLNTERIYLAMAGMYGAFGAYLSNCWIAPLLQKPAVAEEGTFCGSLTLSWNEAAVTTSVGGADYTLSWPAVIGMTETKKTLFIFADRCEAAVIPLNVFEDEKDAAAFKEYVEAQSVALQCVKEVP